jgi:hypothetical protein
MFVAGFFGGFCLKVSMKKAGEMRHCEAANMTDSTKLMDDRS